VTRPLVAEPNPTELQAPGNPALQLALATIGFGVNFWAWALLSPLGKTYQSQLNLSAFQVSLLVATPVVVGSLGRIIIGSLTDKLGARFMFPLISLLTIIPVLFIGFVAHQFAVLELGGFILGLGGTTFAIGVPFVNKWFPPERRGTALGIFGIGMGGTAIAAFSTIPLRQHFGEHAPFLVVAAVLAIYAIVARLLMRDNGELGGTGGGLWARTWQTLRMPVTLQLAWLYAIGFGGFVAFSVYLPTFLANAYGLETGAASIRTAIFVIVAVLSRPLGGMLSDRVGGITVSIVAFALIAVMAFIAAMHPPLTPWGFIVFLVLAAALGASSGATFALVAQSAPASMVGAVTGIVGAVGGLGGFIPPLVMGAIWGAQSSYRLGLLMLAVVAAATLLFTLGPVRRRANAPTVESALESSRTVEVASTVDGIIETDGINETTDVVETTIDEV